MVQLCRTRHLLQMMSWGPQSPYHPPNTYGIQKRMNERQASPTPAMPPSFTSQSSNPKMPQAQAIHTPLSETTKTSSEHTHASDPATTSSHNNPPWRSGKDSQSRRRTRLIYLLGSNIHNRSAYQLRRYKSLEMPTVFQQHARYSSSLSTCRAIPAAHEGRSAILTTSQRSS